jgi:hypothetical protein
MGHAIIAHDGPDPTRRAASRDPRLAAIARRAAGGRLAPGVPLRAADGRPAGSPMTLEEAGAMRDPIAATRHATGDARRDIARHGTRVAGLACRPRPGSGG